MVQFASNDPLARRYDLDLVRELCSDGIAARVLVLSAQPVAIAGCDVVNVPGLDKIYEAYSFHVIPTVGKLVAGDGEPYRYLVESIRQFPAADEFERMIRKAGVRRTGYERLTGGVVAIHSGWKY